MPVSKKKTAKKSARKKTAKKKTVKKAAAKKTVKKSSRPVARKVTGSGMPSVGTRAPSFKLPSTSGELVDSGSFLGRNAIVLYFYPKDDTPGCTVEACSFRDNHSRILSTGTVVVGVSGDSVESHKRFTAKYKLPFLLLADTAHDLAKSYGVWVEKNNYGKKYMGIQRATFLINKDGKVAAAWPKVKVDGHTDEVMDAITSLL
ncbi:MAG: putative peroxiredoxin bcp [Pseudomonadota bacterium]